MRVLVVGSERFTTRPGGLNRYVADLVAALPAAGLEVDALYPGEQVTDPRLPGPLRTVGRLVRATVDTARHLGGVDLVDLHFALYGIGPALLARRRGVPVVVHFHGPWAEESAVAGTGSARARDLKRRLERAVYRRAAALVVLSEAFADRLVRDYGVPRDRVHVIAPGVDHARFTPAPDRVRAAVPTAVAARRLDPRMGLDTAVAAWPEVLTRVPGARLVIAGEGRAHGALQGQIRDLGLEDFVTLEGRVTDERLVDLYRTADVSLVPTRALEGFGLVALEALATGTPVVVTDVDALPEHVGRLDASLVVPAGDAPALADRVARVFGGDAPSRQACASFAGTYTWARTAAAHAELYRTVTGDGTDVDAAGAADGTGRRTVVLLALEWPSPGDAGGGVARHNWRVAHDLARLGHRVVVVTGPDPQPSEAVVLRTVRGARGRLGRYYAVPVRAARAVRRERADAVVAGGDDWALLGTARSRVYHGTARSEARHSTGLRRWNHEALRLAEYVSALDPTARAFTVGPDVPRRRMRTRPLPPVSGVVAATDPAPLSERTGLVFIGPHAGRKRGVLAEAAVAALAAAGHEVPLTVFTARAQDAADWTPGTRVRVGASDADIRDALGGARFLLCTSSYEGFGIPAVEALAAGCLPLSTRTPGAEAVLTGSLAALLGPVDPDAFVAFVLATVPTLGRDADAYRALQRAGTSRVAELVAQGEVTHLLAGGARRA